MEFLEDTEKRILLSAISREKKVCEQVDKESCREPYETSLTDICKSLEYKFMYDRLFKKIYQQGRADAIDEYQKSKLFDKALNIAHAEMFFRWWYQKDIEMGKYNDEEIKSIMGDYLEQLKEQSSYIATVDGVKREFM